MDTIENSEGMSAVAKNLAEIHAEAGVFDPKSLEIPSTQNIISYISKIHELEYLYSFYLNYRHAYIEAAKKEDFQTVSKQTKVSRSADLPFIGRRVIETGTAKYFFVFEGSLSSSERLSVTVLSCLWTLPESEEKEEILKTFWPRRKHSFSYIEKCIEPPSEVLKQSYIFDAVRIGNDKEKRDLKKCRDLMQQEIDLFDPSVVILVGSTAFQIARTIVNERQRMQFPFPTTNFRSKEKLAETKAVYEKLRHIWKS